MYFDIAIFTRHYISIHAEVCCVYFIVTCFQWSHLSVSNFFHTVLLFQKFCTCCYKICEELGVVFSILICMEPTSGWIILGHNLSSLQERLETEPFLSHCEIVEIGDEPSIEHLVDLITSWASSMFLWHSPSCFSRFFCGFQFPKIESNYVQ